MPQNHEVEELKAKVEKIEKKLKAVEETVERFTDPEQAEPPNAPPSQPAQATSKGKTAENLIRAQKALRERKMTQ